MLPMKGSLSLLSRLAGKDRGTFYCEVRTKKGLISTRVEASDLKHAAERLRHYYPEHKGFSIRRN